MGPGSEPLPGLGSSRPCAAVPLPHMAWWQSKRERRVVASRAWPSSGRSPQEPTAPGQAHRVCVQQWCVVRWRQPAASISPPRAGCRSLPVAAVGVRAPFLHSCAAVPLPHMAWWQSERERDAWSRAEPGQRQARGRPARISWVGHPGRGFFLFVCSSLRLPVPVWLQIRQALTVNPAAGCVISGICGALTTLPPQIPHCGCKKEWPIDAIGHFFGTFGHPVLGPFWGPIWGPIPDHFFDKCCRFLDHLRNPRGALHNATSDLCGI